MALADIFGDSEWLIWGVFTVTLSLEGDVEGVMDRPVDDDGTSLHAEREKWDAWYAQRHLSRTEAKRQYITALLNTMNKYASSTPEARELISELEFVWDQIKSNPSSSLSSGDSPVHALVSSASQSQLSHHPSRIISPTPPSRSNNGSQYGSIGGRISRGEVARVAEDGGMDRPFFAGRDSRLRVLSPVSQPDDDDVPRVGRRNYKAQGEEGAERGSELGEAGDEEEDEEDEEEFQEARDSPYDDDDDDDERSDNNNNNNSNNNRYRDNDAGTRRPQVPGGSHGGIDRDRDPDPDRDRDKEKTKSKPKLTYNRRWRRRVEQAMTKMTAEVAAMREQMETRALNSRRRSSLWAWIKWVVWVVVRQVCWDFVLFGCLLVWLRVVKGDRRLEERLKGLKFCTEVKRRVAAVAAVGRGRGTGLGFRLGGFP
ncbi:hypothetical protein AJ78_01668 [Emergomyces pasteurianus Ep9510]|uniref:ACB domain-containing protein n=1 Tax=Emergomyces pasteurianus Ep9510 TaxID=1447872 RepID=A0A1J9QQY8_9EURO|nr:hypothetical protein AJ78_01668 [Emergomyces pasteurianus Ep9510]